MQRFRPTVVLALVALLAPVSAIPAVHEVQVRDNFFSPNDLTINVGDTVRWINANGGAPHDVTADDFSWASVTASSFNFERTFNTVEEVLYHCTVHSSPGRNINTFMNGRLNVVEADGNGFLINDAIGDAWFNPQTDGQGFFIVIWEDSQFMFLSWFTFEVDRPPQDAPSQLGEAGHRWVTAQGEYEGDTAMLDLFVSTGGTFDSGEPPVETVQDGTMEVSFTGCNEGVVSYEVASLGLSGDIPIERIVLDKVPACEAAQAQAQ